MADRADFLVQKLFSLYADRQGATAIEYGLIIGIISMAIVFGLGSVRDGLLSVFEILATTFANAMA
ncbi:Flp family type IVb pilin [Agrobacterium sp. BA1120]|uniref:Flp family type IVb pilin n=1 Tax=Agrobacterium sp. BA1120 TaxID=3228927 RepID=UPI00336ABA03